MRGWVGSGVRLGLRARAQVFRPSKVNDPATYSEIPGNGECGHTASSDEELGAFVSSSGWPELLSYERGGDQETGGRMAFISENMAHSSQHVPCYAEHRHLL